MDIDWKLVIDALQWLTTMAACVYAWLANRKKEITLLREQCGAIDGRLGAIGQRLEGAAGHREFSEINLKLETQRGEMHVLRASHDAQQAQIKGLQYGIDRVNNYLLENRGRK